MFPPSLSRRRKTLSVMSWLFDLVDKAPYIVFMRNHWHTIPIAHQHVSPQSVSAGQSARRLYSEIGGGAQVKGKRLAEFRDVGPESRASDMLRRWRERVPSIIVTVKEWNRSTII